MKKENIMFKKIDIFDYKFFIYSLICDELIVWVIEYGEKKFCVL